MKKILIIAGFLATSVSMLQAQTSWTANGSILYLNPTSAYVGIGTTNPQAKFDVAGSLLSQAVLVKDNSSTGPEFSIINEGKTQPGTANKWSIYNMTSVYGNSLQFWAYDNAGCTGGGLCMPRLTITDSGNVGIGTNNPQYKLEVFGDAQIAGYATINKIQTQKIDCAFDASFVYDQQSLGHYSVGWYNDSWNSANLSLWQSAYGGMKFFTQAQSRLVIRGDGNVGIGTDNPQYKLDVKGEIRATKMRVESIDNFADFVFADDYKLRPLSEVKSHIDSYGHLPEIPTAAEVKENGIELAEMQVKLLQKIEELTLYIIEQDKRIEELENK